ncbi:MAG: NUDIX hydrolase [Dehalococcoidia bacterium]|nr:MAG: NUDIX hydrolase [bacterium]MCE7929300.1 NUDIX hydrolase [Chloroflexi bacterium CFX7]MCK6564410.1 NUDIX hydrolase [Dehalococcoidia bacterium]MCL4231835.1 NUDIX hydrolase [Dehalococcoidia bacterium]NUQ54301.1 NUDIX hydrolase [Dehalococcoidia bacterium]
MSLRARKGPPSVSLILWDGERVLLVKRGGGGLFPHTWTLPGGEIAAGETPEVAAMRLASAEAGVETGHVRRLRTLPQPSHFRDARGPDTLVQLVTWAGDPGAGPGPAEWFGLEALNDLRIFREARDLVREVCAGLPPEPAPAVAGALP